MLIHKMVIFMLKSFDSRSNQISRKIGRIFIRPFQFFSLITGVP